MGICGWLKLSGKGHALLSLVIFEHTGGGFNAVSEALMRRGICVGYASGHYIGAFWN